MVKPSRPVQVRQKEHMNNIRNGKTSISKLAEHVIDQPRNHVPEWNDVEIIMKETNTTRRKIKEAALILLKDDECFAESSIEVDRTWLPIYCLKFNDGEVISFLE